MSYTNRNFTWDFDVLKRFYEKYIVKWLNSAVSWTDAQKKQARANLGFGDGDIDAKPTAGSDNLVNSGGVYDAMRKSDILESNNVQKLYINKTTGLIDSVNSSNYRIYYYEASDNETVTIEFTKNEDNETNGWVFKLSSVADIVAGTSALPMLKLFSLNTPERYTAELSRGDVLCVSKKTNDTVGFIKKTSLFEFVDDINTDISAIEKNIFDINAEIGSINVINASRESWIDFPLIEGKKYIFTSSSGCNLSVSNIKDISQVINVGYLTGNNSYEYTPSDNYSFLRIGTAVSETFNLTVETVGLTNRLTTLELRESSTEGEVADTQRRVLELEDSTSIYEDCGEFLPGTIVTNIDTEVSFERTASSTFISCYVPVTTGEKYKVKAIGGNGPRQWAVLDTEKIVVERSGADASEDVDIAIENDGWLVVNAIKSQDYYLKKLIKVNQKIENIIGDVEILQEDVIGITNTVDGFAIVTDLKKLNFIFGSFSSSGRYNYVTTSLTTPSYIDIKGGSVISCKSGYQYQLITNDGSQTKYTTWNSNPVEFPSDIRIKLSVRKSDTSNIYNNLVLNGLDVSFIIKSPLPLMLRPNTSFGLVPDVLYRGQHEDSTGFGQSTSWEDAMAVWDALVDNDYVTKEDLGDCYDGKHLYCYTLDPQSPKNTSSYPLPTVVITTSLHGHEKSATYGLYYLLRDMIDSPLSNEVTRYLRDNVVFKIIPCVNIYGWDANLRANENGVNLNRNFATWNWEYSDDSYNHTGNYPFSEPETAAIFSVLSKLNNLSLFIDIHTNGLNTGVGESDILWNNILDCTIDGLNYNAFRDFVAYCNNMKSVICSYGVPRVTAKTYVNIIAESERPTAAYYVAQNYGTYASTLEVLCGRNSSEQEQNVDIPNNLVKYTKDVIKLAGEEIGNYIINALSLINRLS